MTKFHNLDDKEVVSSISRLAYFSPTTKDDYGNQIIDYLLLDSLSDFQSTIVIAKDIKANIQKYLLVTFEEDEIISSAKRLAKKSLIVGQYSPEKNNLRKYAKFKRCPMQRKPLFL